MKDDRKKIDISRDAIMFSEIRATYSRVVEVSRWPSDPFYPIPTPVPIPAKPAKPNGPMPGFVTSLYSSQIWMNLNNFLGKPIRVAGEVLHDDSTQVRTFTKDLGGFGTINQCGEFDCFKDKDGNKLLLTYAQTTTGYRRITVFNLDGTFKSVIKSDQPTSWDWPSSIMVDPSRRKILFLDRSGTNGLLLSVSYNPVKSSDYFHKEIDLSQSFGAITQEYSGSAGIYYYGLTLSKDPEEPPTGLKNTVLMGWNYWYPWGMGGPAGILKLSDDLSTSTSLGTVANTANYETFNGGLDTDDTGGLWAGICVIPDNYQSFVCYWPVDKVRSGDLTLPNATKVIYLPLAGTNYGTDVYYTPNSVWWDRNSGDLYVTANTYTFWDKWNTLFRLKVDGSSFTEVWTVPTPGEGTGNFLRSFAPLTVKE